MEPESLNEILSITKSVTTGEWQLPSFQRRFVWPFQRRRALFQSLYKGWPIGSLLIWPKAKRSIVHFKPFELGVETWPAGELKNPTHLVLDGQQRLSTIAQQSVLGMPDQKGGWANLDGRSVRILVFNAKEEIFRWLSPKAAAESKFDSRYELLIPELLQDNFDRITEDFSKRCLERSQKLKFKLDQKKLFSESMPKRTSFHQAVNIFETINTQGTKLTEVDVAATKLYMAWGPLNVELMRFCDRLRRHPRHPDEHRNYAYQKLERQVVLRFLFRLCFDTSDPRTVRRCKAPKESKLRAKWRITQKVFTRFKKHLHSHLQFEEIGLMKRSPLTIAAHFFAQKKYYNSDQEKWKFNHWLLFAVMAKPWSGQDTNAMIEADISAIWESRGSFWDKLIATIEENPRSPGNFDKLIIKPEHFEEQEFRKVLLHLIKRCFFSRKARDWMTSERLASIFKLDHHHIFPKKILLEEEDYQEKEKWDHLANITFLSPETNSGAIRDRAPEDYLTEIKKFERGRELLEGHDVPTVDASLYSIAKYEKFLKARTELLCDSLNAMLAEWRGGKEFTPEISDWVRKPVAELLKDAREDESQYVEFKYSWCIDKETREKRKVLKCEVARQVAAFANSGGGTLIIGVEDDGKIVGVKPDMETLSSRTTLDNAIRESLGTLLRPKWAEHPNTEITIEEVQRKKVVVIRVDGSPKIIENKTKTGEWQKKKRDGRRVISIEVD